MDLRADSGPAPTHATVGVAALEQEMPLSSARCPTESDGTILLQLLEFKTHLLEAVEELHIRRDAETRFEDQISRLVLEKQELEWEKESQQHQAETVVNQHTESLINIKKQFQAKIRNIEEEKGKYQVSAELKDKEINNLKEELKSLQLLKYNLEKKSNELEQKQALQSRSKDSHLNQLGEVEKRFSALSRHCAMVKQAHEKLEQNVDEAMKMNTKLTFANGKQEATIVSLKTELEEVRNKLIKAKMSSVRHDTTQIPTGRDQHIQQLLQKLNMETEMNKRLGEENVGVRAEKQEVMRSLQHTQQLLLSQTQTVSTVEMELQTQREQYQGLKKEHEVMREQSKAMEERLAQLMESYAASQSSWDKEKAKFLDQIKSEHQDLHAAREAYNKLQLKHTELSSQPKVQAQHICESEIKDSSESLSVSNQLFPTLVEEIRGEETLIEPSSSSELPSLSSLKSLTSTLTENPDKGAVTKLVATGATGGQDPLNHHQQSQIKQPLKPSNPFTCSSTKNNNLLSLCSHSGTTGRDSSISNQYLNNSDVCMQISKGSGVSDTSTISSPDHRSDAENADLLSKKKERDEGIGGMIRNEQGLKDDETEGKNNRLQSENDEEQQWSREDVKDRGSSGEHRKTLMVQTTDKADRQEDSQRSTEDSGDTTRPGTETKDIAAKIGLNTPETRTSAQTSADTTTEKSDTPQFIDSMDTESPAACESSDCSLSLLKEVSEKDADTSHVKISRGEHPSFSDEHQSVCLGPNSVDHKVQRGHGEVQISTQDAQSLTQLTSPIDGVHEKTVEENRSAAYIPTTLPEPENQSNVCSSPINAASLAAQSDDTGSIQELEATSTQTQPGNPSNITCYMRQTNVMRDKHVSEECVSVTTLVEPKVIRQSQEISEQQSELTKYLVINYDNFSECKKRKGQLNVDAHENDASDAQEPVEESNLKEVCEDITMDTVDLESDVETGNFPQVKNDQIEEKEHAKTTKHEIDLKLSDNSRHEKEASPETGRTKCYDQFPANETLCDDTNDTSLPSIKTFRSSFGWSIAPRKSESPLSEQNTSGPSRVLGPSPCTIPMFLKSKHSKVPLVITRASDLLNASSVCGTAASSWTHQQGETHREPATADTKKRASPSISSFPVSPSSITDSRRQTTPGCSSGPSSAAGRNSESDWELPLSQEREDQQTSFRTQISKIEQFLNTERLRLPKRRKTDNN